MSALRCYNCGGEVIITPGSRIGVCSACMAEIPVPDYGDFNMQDAYSTANTYLSESRFDEALAAFQEILIQAPSEAAACWGMALAQYGIEYVSDPGTGELLPTLHRLSRENFSSYLYAKKAVQCAADPELEEFYKKQSALIDQIQARSLQISNKEEPYDIFICYKKTEEGEKRTADSRMAADIYRELTQRGYKVFYADESLTVGEEYEPRIFAALQSAQVLIALASQIEYYEAVWVRNEWSRYADLIEKEEAAGGTKRHLIPMFRKMTHSQIPEILRKQPIYVEMDSVDEPRQTLLREVGALFGKEKVGDTSSLRRAAAGVQKKQGKLNEGPGAKTDNLMTRAAIALASGDFETARQTFSKLWQTANSGEACMGLLMCELEIPGKEALHSYAGDIRRSQWYGEAVKAASADERKEYESIADTCLANQAWEEKKAAMQSESKALVEAETNRLRENQKKEKMVLTEEAERLRRDQGIRTDRAAAWKKQRFLRRATAAFIFPGNLLPAIFTFFFLNEETDPAVIGAICFVMFLCYIAFFFYLAGELLPEGCITIITGPAIGFGVLCLVGPRMAGNDKTFHLIYLVLSAAAAVAFLAWTSAGKRAIRTGRLKNENEKPMLEKAMEDSRILWQETLEKRLDEKLAQYRQYYSEEEWNSLRRPYVEAARACIGQRLPR